MVIVVLDDRTRILLPGVFIIRIFNLVPTVQSVYLLDSLIVPAGWYTID